MIFKKNSQTLPKGSVSGKFIAIYRSIKCGVPEESHQHTFFHTQYVGIYTFN